MSAALKRDMIALGLPEEKIRVHHTGIDLDRFRPVDRAAAKAALGVDGPLLISVGHLNARKGQEIALAALAKIPGATLFLAGDGPERARLEREAGAKGLASRVRFLGVQPHDALPGLLAAADIMVLPTISEGLANVWVEALACGTPVVTSDVGGAREVVDRPEAGRLVPRDPTPSPRRSTPCSPTRPPRRRCGRRRRSSAGSATRRSCAAHLSALAR